MLGPRHGDVRCRARLGRLIRTFAFRGAVHLHDAGDPRRCISRSGRRVGCGSSPSWQTFYKLKPADWPDFRAAVRDALADGPTDAEPTWVPRSPRHPRYSHLGFVFTDDNWTLLKPLAWQGDMAFGPPTQDAPLSATTTAGGSLTVGRR